MERSLISNTRASNLEKFNLKLTSNVWGCGGCGAMLKVEVGWGGGMGGRGVVIKEVAMSYVIRD